MDDDISESDWKSELIARCGTTLAGLDFSRVDLDDPGEPEPPSLYQFHAELAALRNEQKLGNRRFSGVLENFTSILQSMGEERERQLRDEPAAGKSGNGETNRSFALGLIDLRDRLDRILEKSEDADMTVKAGLFGKKSATPEPWKTHCESLEILARHFAPALAAAGIERIRTEGERYDPGEMKAVSAPSGESLGQLVVVRELLPGYRWQGRCLRPAEVEIDAAPQTPDNATI